MRARIKQVKLNNYSVVDINPNENFLQISKFENDLISKYINQVFGDEEKGMELSKISSNFFYESYSVIIDKKKFLLKISLDPDNQKLSTEKNALQHISDYMSPKIIAHKNNKADGIEFLLMTWENGQSFEDFGIDALIYNFGTLCCVIDGIHESEKNDITEFKNKFLQNESVLSLLESIDPKDMLIFEKLVDLNMKDLKDIFSKIREACLTNYTEDVPVLSHGNIKKSNILYSNGYIKLINFEN